MNHIPDFRRAFMLRGAAIAAAVAAPGIARSTGALLVGMSLPLRGPQSRQAEATRQGVDACFEQANRAGGVAGSLLQLVTVDNEYSPEKTAESLKTFAAQRAVALTSLMGGPLISAAIPVAREVQLPIVGVIHGGDNLRAPGTEIVTHVRVNFAGELAAIARVFVTVGRRRFAVLHASDSSGKAFLNQFSAALNTHGLPIVAAVPYERDTKDFTPMAKAVGASGADVVVVGGVTGPGIAFIRAMRARQSERRSRVCRQLMIALFRPNWEIRREVSHSQALFQALRTRCYLSFANTKPRWR